MLNGMSNESHTNLYFLVVSLPSAELRHDCVVRFDDLERVNGSNW